LSSTQNRPFVAAFVGWFATYPNRNPAYPFFILIHGCIQYVNYPEKDDQQNLVTELAK